MWKSLLLIFINYKWCPFIHLLPKCKQVPLKKQKTLPEEDLVLRSLVVRKCFQMIFWFDREDGNGSQEGIHILDVTTQFTPKLKYLLTEIIYSRVLYILKEINTSGRNNFRWMCSNEKIQIGWIDLLHPIAIILSYSQN